MTDDPPAAPVEVVDGEPVVAECRVAGLAQVVALVDLLLLNDHEVAQQVGEV